MASPVTDAAAARPANPGDATRVVSPRAYFPCFEGLRALAASAVVLYHAVTLAGPDATGWLYTPVSVLDMSVPVFFVISGFLIYRPFVAATAGDGPSIGVLPFWWRRVLRIVPAYWLALSVMWALGWVELGEEPWRFYLFLQIYDAYTTLGGIVPAWSLNTEMTFYLLVPLWAVLVRRVVGVAGRSPATPPGAGGRPDLLARSLRGEMAGIAVLFALGYASRASFSQVDRVWALSGDGQPVTMRQVAFSWLPNNIDVFALGMALAVLSVAAAHDAGLRARLARWAQPAGAWWAVAAVVWLGFAYGLGGPDLHGGYQGAYWQVRQACFSLVAVALVVPAVFGDQGRGAIRRGLRARPVVWLGLVSFALYLWHQELLERLPVWLARPPWEVPLVVLVAGTFALSAGAAAASWYGLEKPLADIRRRAR